MNEITEHEPSRKDDSPKIIDLIKKEQQKLSEKEIESAKLIGGINVDANGNIIFPGGSEFLKDRILYEEHVRLGHASATSLMISLQKEGVRFAGMERLAKELISSCVYCQKLSHKGYKRAFATIASRKAFEEVSIDTLGPIPEDVHGFKFLL
ncbi:hypothetical protein ADUPG1_005263, partial [Aduncisulcus paluster]